jgi:CHASE2 domain-containing sensor protein
MFLSRIIKFRESGIPLLLALFATMVTVGLMTTGFLDNFELNSFDRRCQWRGARKPGDDVFLLVVDEGFLQYGPFGMFPWPRSVWAEIQGEFINNPEYDIKPRTIAYDVLFDQADTTRKTDTFDPDTRFAEEIEKSDNVLLAFSFLKPSLNPVSATDSREYDPFWRPPSPRFRRDFALDRRKIAPGEYYHGTSLIRPLQDFERAARGIGHTNTPADSADMITRRYPMLIEHDGDYFPSLPIVAVCHYLGIGIKSIRVDQKGQMILPRPGKESIRIPLDRHGNLLLSYYGADLNVFPSLSMAHFLNSFDSENPQAREQGKPNRMKVRILVIGSTAASTHDLRPATMNELYPLVGNVATAIANILGQDFFRTANWAANVSILLRQQ